MTEHITPNPDPDDTSRDAEQHLWEERLRREGLPPEPRDADFDLYGLTPTHDTFRTPAPPRLPDVRKERANSIRRGRRRIATWRRGEAWTGPTGDLLQETTAVVDALVADLAGNIGPLFAIGDQPMITEAVDAAIHYLYCAWLDADHRRLGRMPTGRAFNPATELGCLQN